MRGPAGSYDAHDVGHFLLISVVLHFHSPAYSVFLWGRRALFDWAGRSFGDEGKSVSRPIKVSSFKIPHMPKVVSQRKTPSH